MSITVPKINATYLNARAGSDFEVNSSSVDLDSFVSGIHVKKERSLNAFKDLFSTFIQDIINYDSENKANLVNFLYSNHRKFVEDLVEDDTLMSKLDPIIDQVISIYAPSIATSSSSFDHAKMMRAIRDICHQSIKLGRNESNDKQLTTEISGGNSSKPIFDLKAKKNLVLNRIAKLNSPSASRGIPSYLKFKNVLIMPKNILVKSKMNMIRTKSLLTKLMGISTLSVRTVDALTRMNAKATKKSNAILNFFKDNKLDHFFKKQVWESYLKKKRFWESAFLSLFSPIGYGMLILWAREWNDSVWKWSKNYVKKFVKGAIRHVLGEMFPLFGVGNFNLFRTLRRSNVIRKFLLKFKIFNRWISRYVTPVFKVLGNVFKGVWNIFTFVTGHYFSLIKKLASMVKNPIQKIISFAIKLVMKPWAVMFLGVFLGKLMGSIVDVIFTGDIDKSLERRKDKNMSFFEQLGSEGLGIYVQKELDVISTILDAINDSFLFNGKKSPFSKAFNFMGFDGSDKDNNEIDSEGDRTLDEKQEDQIYDFVFSVSNFMHEWFFNGEKSKIKVYFRQTVDFIKSIFSKILLKYKLEYLENEYSDDMANKYMKTYNLLVDFKLNDKVEKLLEFIINLLGMSAEKYTGSVGFKLGVHLPGTPALKLAGGIFGALFTGLMGSAITTSFLRSKLNVNKNATEDATEFIQKVQNEHFDIRSTNTRSMISRNLREGYQKSTSIFKKINTKNAEEKGIVESAQKAEEKISEIFKDNENIKKRTMYKPASDNMGITDVIEQIEDTHKTQMDKINDLNTSSEMADPSFFSGVPDSGFKINLVDGKYQFDNQKKRQPLNSLIEGKFPYPKLKVEWEYSGLGSKVEIPISSTFKKAIEIIFYDYYDFLLINALKQGKISVETFVNLYNNPNKISFAVNFLQEFINEKGKKYIYHHNGPANSIDKNKVNFDFYKSKLSIFNIKERKVKKFFQSKENGFDYQTFQSLLREQQKNDGEELDVLSITDIDNFVDGVINDLNKEQFFEKHGIDKGIIIDSVKKGFREALSDYRIPKDIFDSNKDFFVDYIKGLIFMNNDNTQLDLVLNYRTDESGPISVPEIVEEAKKSWETVQQYMSEELNENEEYKKKLQELEKALNENKTEEVDKIIKEINDLRNNLQNVKSASHDTDADSVPKNRNASKATEGAGNLM